MIVRMHRLLTIFQRIAQKLVGPVGNPVIGYSKGAEVAKEAMASGRTVRQVVLEKGYLSAAEADKLLDVRALTEGGIQG